MHEQSWSLSASKAGKQKRNFQWKSFEPGKPIWFSFQHPCLGSSQIPLSLSRTHTHAHTGTHIHEHMNTHTHKHPNTHMHTLRLTHTCMSYHTHKHSLSFSYFLVHCVYYPWAHDPTKVNSIIFFLSLTFTQISETRVSSVVLNTNMAAHQLWKQWALAENYVLNGQLTHWLSTLILGCHIHST